MALVDEVTLHLSAGRGGDGVVRWRHEKSNEYGGPSGGDGGKGGNVYACAIRDIEALARFRRVKKLHAQNGGSGKSNTMRGVDGESLLIEVPVGSIVSNLETGECFELLNENERVLLLAGGAGGLGNTHFKNSIRQRPKECTQGATGESATFSVELQLIADIGIIGLPNAGKSSLLNALTKAHARVGSYAFTTLEPNLGVMYGYVLADIPGLITGSSEGKGLGDKFLRHIRRTKMLAHCISLEENNFEQAYLTVRGELGKYSAELLRKPEIIVLTKSDLVDEMVLAKARAWSKKIARETFEVSVLDSISVKNLSKGILSMISSPTEPVKN